MSQSKSFAVACGVMLTIAFTWSSILSGQESLARELWQVRYAMSEAAFKKDIPAWSAVTTQDWMLYDYDGTIVTKEQRFEEIKVGARASMRQVLPKEPPADWSVRVHGVVATGFHTVNTTGPDGKPGQRRVIHIFVRDAGRWLSYHDQETPVGIPSR